MRRRRDQERPRWAQCYDCDAVGDVHLCPPELTYQSEPTSNTWLCAGCIDRRLEEWGEVGY